MTRGKHAADCISHSISSQPANFVWISDALLTQTLSRFCQQRRHGSCVPGPLEARRRASRRKTTSLAFPSWGDVFTNPSELIERGAQPAAWWQNGVNWSPDQRKARHSLLSWLLRPPKPPPVQAVAPDAIHTISEPEPALLSGLVADALLPNIEGCQTLDDIRIRIQQRPINLQCVPAFCDTVLDHLLKSPNWAKEIPALLTAPEFHPAGSSLHLKFFTKLQGLPLALHTWELIRNSIFQATTLGLVSPSDLRNIFAIAGSMKLPLPKASTARTHKGNFLHGLVMAINRSSVLHLSDLGKPCLKNLISLLGKHARFSNALFVLGPWATEENADVFIRVVLMRLKDMPRTQELKGDATYDLASDLSKLKTAVLLQALPQVSMHLLGNHPHGPTKINIGKLTFNKILKFKKVPRFLVNWRLTLAYLGTITSNMTTENNLFTNILNGSPDQQYSQLLAAAWTYISMCHDYAESRSLLQHAGFASVFCQVSQTESNPFTNDRLGRLVVEVYQLAIPNKSFLISNIAPFIFNRSKLVTSQSQHRTALQGLINRDYSMLVGGNMFRNAWQNYPYELVDLAESINPHLALFKVLSRKWIYHEWESYFVIKRLLRHNHYLKVLLSQLGPDGTPFRIAQHYKKTHQLQAEGMPTPLEALSFINHVAASIATTEMFSPRGRLNKLYWLYLYLHKTRAPITKEFTQALWYVCMLQRGGRGPSWELLKWVLEQITIAEGADTATLLQVSSIARQKRQE
ncbi:uncharacterized protein A1O9_04943, partial [Exophiala aquamarina CBS 119918]